MFKKIDLPFKTEALEPIISSQTIDIHYNKHHDTYVKKLNEVVEKNQPELFEKELQEVLLNIDSLVNKNIKKAVYNNGWQIINHNIFWESICTNQDQQPEGNLREAINRDFGSLEDMKKILSETTITQFGSGWGWLVSDDKGTLSVVATPNADNPLLKGLQPLLTIDVWEHAYYLDYQNRRPDFVEAVWNIINWEEVEEKYAQSRK